MSVPSIRILFVDDDNDSCDLMKFMLRQADGGFDIKTTLSFREASALIEQESFDFYIFDYALPDGTGIELCRKVRQVDSDTPVMFFSAMARDIDRQKAMDAGATAYLVKPDDLENFTEMVKHLLFAALGTNSCGYRVKSFKKD